VVIGSCESSNRDEEEEEEKKEETVLVASSEEEEEEEEEALTGNDDDGGGCLDRGRFCFAPRKCLSLEYDNDDMQSSFGAAVVFVFVFA
jgi:hypothetical protein